MHISPILREMSIVSDCMCSALRMAARRLTQLYDSKLMAVGLSTAQFSLLSALKRSTVPPTMNDLADRMGLDRTTLAHNLRPLDRDGLVSVGVDPDDRRVRRIALTPAGEARRRRAEPLWSQAQAQFEADYGSERARGVHDALLDIARAGRAPAPGQTTDGSHVG